VSPKYSSLAFDEAVKEFDRDYDIAFEPELKVIVNANYMKAPVSPLASAHSDVIQVRGSITVSF